MPAAVKNTSLGWRRTWSVLWPDKETWSHKDTPSDFKKIRKLQILLTGITLVVSYFLGRYLIIEIPVPYRLKIIALLLGLETTLILGALSGWLLETYVTVQHPKEMAESNFETDGGGIFLGFLERIIFFAAFWKSPTIGGAWLVFKLGAKWGVWQHVIKYPEPSIYGSRIREQMASRLLGRFLNGTLWNAICGLVGAAITAALWSYFV